MDDLYVVMSSLPGPGAPALVREALSLRGVMSRIIDDAVEAAEAGCEFVEVETAACSGVFRDAKLSWEQHPVEGPRPLYRLGPFAKATDRDRLLEACRAASLRLLQCAVCGAVPAANEEHQDGCPLTGMEWRPLPPGRSTIPDAKDGK